jgi:hypothetical protein
MQMGLVIISPWKDRLGSPPAHKKVKTLTLETRNKSQDTRLVFPEFFTS